jgi:hypothetical protein
MNHRRPGRTPVILLAVLGAAISVIGLIHTLHAGGH